MKGDNMKNKMDPIGNLIRHGSFAAKWTTFFATIAVFSVLVLGLTQVSFALEDWPATLTNSKIDRERQLTSEGEANGVPNGGIANKFITKQNGGEIPVYCLEAWEEYGAGDTYTKQGSKKILDDGAIALLTKAYAQYPSPQPRQQALIQLALWAYLYENNSAWKAENDQPQNAEESGMNADQMQKLKSGSLWKEISPWIDFAKGEGAKNYDKPTITFSKSSNDFTVNGSNNEYLISGEITIGSTPLDTLESFNLGLSNATANTKVIVIKGGQEHEYDQKSLSSVQFSKSDISNGLKVKVKIPTSELSEQARNFQLTANGSYSYYVGYEYFYNDEYQTIAVGNPETAPTKASLDLSASYKVEVPETAKDSSTLLYIIGLIVLLCGTGIVYVNVKPARQK